MSEVDCPACQGTGETKDRCYHCRGTGKMRSFDECNFDEKQFAVLELMNQGKTYREIGAILELHAGSIRNRAHRIRDIIEDTCGIYDHSYNAHIAAKKAGWIPTGIISENAKGARIKYPHTHA